MCHPTRPGTAGVILRINNTNVIRHCRAESFLIILKTNVRPKSFAPNIGVEFYDAVLYRWWRNGRIPISSRRQFKPGIIQSDYLFNVLTALICYFRKISIVFFLVGGSLLFYLSIFENRSIFKYSRTGSGKCRKLVQRSF